MALDANPEASTTNDDREPAAEPIFPTGPPLNIPPDAVDLTFLDLEGIPDPSFDPDGLQEIQHPGLEIKTPLGVRIPVFEGPLDLLLYLIRRDKVDIYDIPIAPITEKYLAMLGVLKVLDLEMAGEFLVMAATLMRIKARMLLPTWPDDEEEDDPRSELIRQLLEYRQFKEAAHTLKEKEEERRLLFGRGFVPEFEAEVPVELEPMSHFVLIDVMKDVLARAGEEFFYSVELEDVTLEEKVELILGELEEKGRALFVDLISRTPRRIHVVVTFMAILELAKMGRLAVAQEASFGQIWVYPVKDGRVVTEAAEEGAPIPDPDAGQGMLGPENAVEDDSGLSEDDSGSSEDDHATS